MSCMVVRQRAMSVIHTWFVHVALDILTKCDGILLSRPCMAVSQRAMAVSQRVNRDFRYDVMDFSELAYATFEP